MARDELGCSAWIAAETKEAECMLDSVMRVVAHLLLAGSDNGSRRRIGQRMLAVARGRNRACLGP